MQKRMEQKKERQELVRQGWLDTSKPKGKLSDLMRMLGTNTVVDPTALECVLAHYGCSQELREALIQWRVKCKEEEQGLTTRAVC